MLSSRPDRDAAVQPDAHTREGVDLPDHAYLRTARFFDDPAKLGTVVDFGPLQRRDFQRNPERPDKVERYQAEALAHRFVPVGALLGVGCYTAAIKTELEATCRELGVQVKFVHRTEWFFS